MITQLNVSPAQTAPLLTVAEPTFAATLIARYRTSAETMTDTQIAEALLHSIANSVDANNQRNAEIAMHGEPADDTDAEARYFTDLVHIWTVIANERNVNTLETISRYPQTAH